MDNTALNDGGGVYSDRVTSVTISDSTFSRNSAQDSAQVHACCHTGPFVLSFCMHIAMMTSFVQKMHFDIAHVDAMIACHYAHVACCLMARRCLASECNAGCRVAVVASSTTSTAHRVYSASRCVILRTILPAAAVVASTLE